MIRFLLPIAAAFALVGCGSDSADTQQDRVAQPATTASMPVADTPAAADRPAAGDKKELTAEAKQAVMALGSTLKTQLQAAIKTGGPASAVDVCHKIAPATAAAISEERGMTLTRVSLKNRNPEMGVPNAWQTRVLQDFEARKAAGESPDQLAYSEIVDNEYRFMKAIPTAQVCLTCHGVDVQPEVAARISEFYPEDRATGYAEGDIRGAFVVVRPLPPAG